MTRAEWTEAKRLAGPSLLTAHFRHYLRGPLAGGVGVYIADSCLASGVDYVGSVVRTRDPIGIARRLREHARSERGAPWLWVHVLVLHPSTPVGVVRTLEGHVGALVCPARNKRLPRS